MRRASSCAVRPGDALHRAPRRQPGQARGELGLVDLARLQLLRLDQEARRHEVERPDLAPLERPAKAGRSTEASVERSISSRIAAMSAASRSLITSATGLRPSR
jgi:hypothetical protein